jgi:hypothetical protein
MSNDIAITKQNSVADFGPKNFTELEKFASIICRTPIVPKEYREKPHDALATMIFGNELGLSPLQSLQNISNINGRTCIWGDAMLALVISHKDCEYIKEERIGSLKDVDGMGYSCTVKRVGHDPHTVTFTKQDAVKAGLWGKPGPWTNYTARMLQLRSRGFALRDKFPDALRGIISREEAEDMQLVGQSTTEQIDIHSSHVVQEPWPETDSDGVISESSNKPVLSSKEDEINSLLG